MCRNIRTLYNYEPPATAEEIRAAALQYVRKVSGFQKPSIVNKAVFEAAVEKVFDITTTLVEGLETNAPAKDRDSEIAKARARNQMRFAPK